MKQSVNRLTLVAVLMLLCIVPALAQTMVTTTGTVVDETNEPLIGVSVTPADSKTNMGVTTDIDGVYSIKVPAGTILRFSYIGYQAQTAKAINGTIDITLKEDNKTLNEVVVVGYGVQ